MKSRRNGTSLLTGRSRNQPVAPRADQVGQSSRDNASTEHGAIHDDLTEVIAREELAGLAHMFWARLIVLGLLAIWLVLALPFDRSGL